VRIALNAHIRNVHCDNPARPAAPRKFTVTTQSAEYSAAKLIVSTGGLSIPKMGATGFGYDLARQVGLPIVEPRPALVPFTLGGSEHGDFADLTGVSALVTASCGKRTFREKMLFTHRGLSGPAILQISSYWHAGESIRIDWAPGVDLLAPLLRSSSGRDLAAARAALRTHLPARLADRLLDVATPAGFTNHVLAEYERRLHAWTFTPSGTEGFDKAEVTAGGVSTDALSAQTLETRSVPGLHFIGEVVDVTGHLGGFNFQWAWASGAAAGRAI
jgi:predicted Rossmann fold flavoprotein